MDRTELFALDLTASGGTLRVEDHRDSHPDDRALIVSFENEAEVSLDGGEPHIVPYVAEAWLKEEQAIKLRDAINQFLTS